LDPPAQFSLEYRADKLKSLFDTNVVARYPVRSCGQSLSLVPALHQLDISTLLDQSGIGGDADWRSERAADP
jgi:hypothetical protein